MALKRWPHLNISSRGEDSAIFPPLDVNGHVTRGDGAGHLGPVTLLEVSIKCEGGNLGRLNCIHQDMASSSVPLAVGDNTGILSTVWLFHLLTTFEWVHLELFDVHTFIRRVPLVRGVGLGPLMILLSVHHSTFSTGYPDTGHRRRTSRLVIPVTFTSPRVIGLPLYTTFTI